MKKIYWNKLTQSEQEDLLPLIPAGICIGIHKTNHSFYIALDEDQTLFVSKDDMQRLLELNIAPHCVIDWPEHGPRYINFHEEFQALIRLIMTLALIQGSVQNIRRVENRSNVSSSGTIRLPSGQTLSITASLTYNTYGVILDCHVLFPGKDGHWHRFLKSELQLPDDKCARTIMTHIFKEACTRERLLSFADTLLT